MKSFKKIVTLLLALVMLLSLAACGETGKDGEKKPEEKETTTEGGEKKAEGEATKVDKLTVQFVPSRDPEDIMNQTKPLSDMLKKYLKESGFEVGEVEISVGTTYEATGEALSAGSIDIGLIPGGTYTLYDDGAEVLLTATRKGLSIDSEDPKDWNDNKPTAQKDEQVTYYKSLIIAGPSEKGQELAKKVNAGEELTWEDLNSAKWGVRGASSSSGYIYPYLWLQEKYGKTLTDLETAIETDSYTTSVAKLASEEVDIVVGFADLRMDNHEELWTKDFKREKSIWDETAVIGVTPNVYNDTVSVSKNSKTLTPELKEAIANAFIELAKTPEGKEVISIYSHEGYEKAKSEDYDNERKAQEVMKEINK